MSAINQNSETNPAHAAGSTSGTAAQGATPYPKASRRSRLLVIAVVAILLVAGLVGGIIPRVRAQGKLAASAAETTQPVVNVTNISRVAGGLDLTLPGDVRAYEETRIYARADGYLLKWHNEIGTKVDAGQVLAIIDTPELDQELNQARATLAQAQANLSLARSSSGRWESLLKDRAVSQQEVDEKLGALAAREADVTAAQAAVARFEKLASFKEVRAPFAGTITRRFVDTGSLIRAGSSGDASALFQLAQTDTLRVQVNVPQSYLRDVVAGAPVQVKVAEYPDRQFTGKILRTSGAFDPTTRTLLTEIEVPNRDGALFPGIHVDVQLTLARSNPPLMIPSASVMSRSGGLLVAVVDSTGVIQLKKVQVGRDLGQTMEIVEGLAEGDRVVLNPTDTLAPGAAVKVAGLGSKTAQGQIAKR